MTAENKKLILFWLGKAKNAYRAGDTLMRVRSYDSAVNRFYYAAFYAARAVLATKGLDASKHTGVISLFQIHFVKTELIPKDLARALRTSFEVRLDGDYGDYVEITIGLASQIKSDVKSFVAACDKFTKSTFPKR